MQAAKPAPVNLIPACLKNDAVSMIVVFATVAMRRRR
jgi:hypothetical protein